MSVLYRAKLSAGAYLQAPSHDAYNFGTEDFTVLAMVTTTNPGPLVSRCDTAVSQAGFYLLINSMGSIVFYTSDGSQYMQAVSNVTGVLDDDCHTIAGVRLNGQLQILVDGVPVRSTQTGSAASPVNVNTLQPLSIGSMPQTPGQQLVGSIMNVGVWKTGLQGNDLVQAMFGRVQTSDTKLQGFWSLDQTNSDSSQHGNTASITGSVVYEPCVNCVWTEGANHYAFCEMVNLPASGDEVPGNPSLAMMRTVVVKPGTPALYGGIMADSDHPAFPSGATLTITDPLGNKYDKDQNTDDLFVGLSNGQPWAFMSINPRQGKWMFSLSVPASTGCVLQIQTIPSQEVVTTTEQALQPLYGPETPSRFLERISLRGFTLAITAVAAIAAVVLVALGPATGGASLKPAVQAGMVALAGVVAYSLMPASDSLSHTSKGLAGMAGFVVAPQAVLLVDANCAGDRATLDAFQGRAATLYPAVRNSSFNRVQVNLIGREVTRANVSAKLASFTAGYVTMSGHGKPSFLAGWYKSGSSGPMEEVLWFDHYQRVEVAGKIFHIFGCNTGYDGPVGLGLDVVRNGAVAFFGYSAPIAIDSSRIQMFCDGDIAIDLALIAGKTCHEAYRDAIVEYNRQIAACRADDKCTSAAYLERNRDLLVCPSTDPRFGNKEARLNTGWSS